MQRIALASMLPVAVVVLSGCLAPPAMIAADVVVAAVKAGVEYADENRPTPDEVWVEGVVERLRARAEAGDTESAFRLGTWYERAGQPETQHWTCQAANGGHPKAQTQMGHWFNEDRATEDLWPFVGLRPDNRRAYLWYSLAVGNGHASAAHFRDRIAEDDMSPAQVTEAERLIAGWKPGACASIATASNTPEKR